MANETNAGWKTWVPVLAFLAQGLTTVVYITQSLERTTASVDALKTQVTELKTSNQALVQVTTEVAVLRVRMSGLEEQVADVRASQREHSNHTVQGANRARR